MSPLGSAHGPPRSVLASFGVEDDPVRLSGGRGLTWRSGDVVLRPVEGDAEARWKSEVLSGLPANEEFIVPRPRRTVRGEWLTEGWQAMEWIPGEADEERLRDVIRAGAAFHRAMAPRERPQFLDDSADPWSRADRIAWEEEAPPADPLLEKLGRHYRAVAEPNQVIHGDLLGNVLFARGRPPAIIDWAPYWRPPGYGAAVAAVDAVCWHGLPTAALRDDQGIPEWRQMLLRALVFRMATLHVRGDWRSEDEARHAPVVDAVIALDLD